MVPKYKYCNVQLMRKYFILGCIVYLGYLDHCNQKLLYSNYPLTKHNAHTTLLIPLEEFATSAQLYDESMRVRLIDLIALKYQTGSVIWLVTCNVCGPKLLYLPCYIHIYAEGYVTIIGFLHLQSHSIWFRIWVISTHFNANGAWWNQDWLWLLRIKIEWTVLCVKIYENSEQWMLSIYINC